MGLTLGWELISKKRSRERTEGLKKELETPKVMGQTETRKNTKVVKANESSGL